MTSACVSGNTPPVGTYLDSTGAQSIIITSDFLKIKMLSRVFGEKQARMLHLQVTYSVNKHGDIRMFGSSNS